MLYFETRQLAREFARKHGRKVAPTKTERGWGVKVL